MESNMTTITISLGEAGETSVDTAKFNDAVQAYIFQYGLKQMLNDVHAGETKGKTPDDKTRAANKLALVNKKLTSLYNGEVAQARVGSTGSPVEREMRAMAEADLKAKIKSIGKKVADFDKEVWAQVIVKQVAANEAAYRAAAEAKLAIKPETEATSADDLMAMLTAKPEEKSAE
jgi:hypothetical protein